MLNTDENQSFLVALITGALVYATRIEQIQRQHPQWRSLHWSAKPVGKPLCDRQAWHTGCCRHGLQAMAVCKPRKGCSGKTRVARERFGLFLRPKRLPRRCFIRSGNGTY